MKSAALGIPILVAGLFAGSLLARGHPYDVDQVALALPYTQALQEAARAGRLPLWHPGIWGGYPIHAEGQGGFTSPLALLALLAPDALAALELQWLVLLLGAAAAGAGGALLLGLEAEGAALCGVVWSLGGGLLAYQENHAFLAAFALLPLALGLAWRGRLVPLALTVGAAVLSGHPYGWATLLLLAAPAWAAGPGAPRGLGARAGGLAVAAGLGLLLGGVQLVPTCELLLESDRWAGQRPEQLRQALYHLEDLRHLLLPWFPARVRHSSDSALLAYLGLPCLALAGLGAWRGRGERLWRALAGLLLATPLLALLLSTTIGELVARLPGVGLVRGPSKLLVLTGLAAALLAGRGAGALPDRRLRWALLALVALDLGSYGHRKAIPVPRQALRVRPALAEALAGERALIQLPPLWGFELTRASDPVAFAREAGPLDANAGVRFGVEHLDGYGPLRVRRTLDYCLRPTAARLRRAATPLLVVPAGTRVPAELAPVASSSRWAAWRLPGTLPRAYLCPSARAASGPEQALALLEETPAGTAVIEGPGAADLAAALAREGSAAPLPARVLRWEPGQLELEVDAPAPGVLVVTDAAFPGWVATVDAAPAALLVANAAWKGVALDAGHHRVQLSYRPWSWWLGLVASLAGVAALAALARRGPLAPAVPPPPASG